MRIFIASRAVHHDCACAIITEVSSIQPSASTSFLFKHLFFDIFSLFLTAGKSCESNCVKKRAWNYYFIFILFQSDFTCYNNARERDLILILRIYVRHFAGVLKEFFLCEFSFKFEEIYKRN